MNWTDDLAGDEYLIRRKIITIFGAKFHVYDGGGNLILFSKQKAFRLKEDIRVYRDETMREECLLIRARQIIDFSAAYDVVDPLRLRKIGALRRKGFSSIVRDSWQFLDEDDNPIAQLREDSMILALVRRLVLNLVPQRFRAERDGQTLITYRQRFNPFVLKLDVALMPGVRDVVDPRLALAAGILLAAVEGRQN